MATSNIILIIIGMVLISTTAYLVGRLLSANSKQAPNKLQFEQLANFMAKELSSSLSKELGQQNIALQQKFFTWVTDESRKTREEIQKGMLTLATANTEQQKKMQEGMFLQLNTLSENVNSSLQNMQRGNEKKLEEMRATVDEKLNETLEKRLTQSFTKVGEMLSSLSEKFGEMKTLSANFQEVKNVFSNVKKRGILGELHLQNLLDDVLGTSQYKKNIATKENSNDKVEFVVIIPSENGQVHLPIDSKFPTTSYEAILTAQENGDGDGLKSAQKAFAKDVRAEAKKISEKYINPPFTSDYAILFLPSEALYAEAAQLSLISGDDSPWRECRIMVTGPATLTAILTSFRMAFNMIKMTKHQSEAFRILGVLQTAFAGLSKSLEASEKQIEKAGEGLRKAQRQSKKISKELGFAESLEIENSHASKQITANFNDGL